RVDAFAEKASGVRPAFLGVPLTTGISQVFADWYLVAESTARGMDSTPHIRVIDAEESGDDAIVAQVEHLVSRHAHVTVVTSDAELRVRCLASGAETARGSARFLKLLDQAEAVND